MCSTSGTPHAATSGPRFAHLGKFLFDGVPLKVKLLNLGLFEEQDGIFVLLFRRDPDAFFKIVRDQPFEAMSLERDTGVHLSENISETPSRDLDANLFEILYERTADHIPDNLRDKLAENMSEHVSEHDPKNAYGNAFENAS